MKIAIIGYGRMGHAIEALAAERGHHVVARVDAADSWPAPGLADVAVEFTTPQTAADNLLRCFAIGLPVVCGTTGWYDRYDEVCRQCEAQKGALLAATNFSIGMNIMFALNRRLAELMRGRGYRVSISEVHHVHKLDAPSGTALTLRDQIVASRAAAEVPIASRREGEVPGTHTVVYDSPVDTITLSHEAHSRAGLAQGALLAAEWLCGRQGVFSMDDLLQ